MIPRSRNQIPRLLCHSTRVLYDPAGMREDSAGLRDDSTRVLYDPAGMREDSASVRDDSTRVLYDPAGMREDSASVRDDSTRVLCDPAGMREDSAGLLDRLCRLREEVPRGREGSPARGTDLPCGGDPLPCLACACARIVLSVPAGGSGWQPENAAGHCRVGSAYAAWAALPYSESFCRIFRIVSLNPNIFVRRLESRKSL